MFSFECSHVYSMIIYTMSNGGFNDWWAILLCIFLFMFMCFDSKNNYLWLILTCEQYYIAHELISCSLGTAWLVLFFLVLCDLDVRESKTRHCDYSLHYLSICIIDRHLHIILKVKNTKIYVVGWALTSKTFYFCYLTYDGRTAN